MPPLKSLTFTELITFKPKSDNSDVRECLYPPQTMGNPLNIAYGGFALAVACKAAYLSVPNGYHLYSMLGNYLGPAFADRPLFAKVRTIRQTRTFATRQVAISQKRDDGEQRPCMIALLDFQTKENKLLFEYSKQPTKSYTHYNDCLPEKELHQKLLKEVKADKSVLEEHGKLFSLLPDIFDHRPCPEGIFAQTLGMMKAVSTTQDHLPLTSRSTADWFRCHDTLETPADHLANIAFLIDGAISFVPLSFSKMWFDAISACSSLDFSLRFFKSGDEIDMTKWHLKEITTSVGSEARTYGEAWIWDESGRAVACMSQQCIMRPAVGVATVKEKL